MRSMKPPLISEQEFQNKEQDTIQHLRLEISR